MLDNLTSNFVLALSELRNGDFLSRPDLVDQRKIRRCEHAEVLTILLVDTFDILRDHDLDSSTPLRIR